MNKDFNFIKTYKEHYYLNLKNFRKKISKNFTLILLYHGVTEIKSKGIENFSKKHIYYKDFKNQMKYIKDNFNLISMDEIIYQKKDNYKLPKKSVVITFDDGFENNYNVAAPILDELNIPSVFYVSSGMIGTKTIFWVDVIEDCINRTKKIELNLEIKNKIFKYDLNGNKNKIEALNKIKSLCKISSSSTKDDIINQVIKKTKIIPSERSSQNYKVLSWKQVKEINKNSLFRVGGHSMYHDILSMLPKEIMEEDIKKSIELLRDNLNEDVIHYSYPEGLKKHFNKNIQNTLKLNGIKCCPTAIAGFNTINTDLFELKRVMTGFWGMPLPFLDREIN